MKDRTGVDLKVGDKVMIAFTDPDYAAHDWAEGKIVVIDHFDPYDPGLAWVKYDSGETDPYSEDELVKIP